MPGVFRRRWFPRHKLSGSVLNAAYAVSITETLTATDALDATGNFSVALVESATATDALNATGNFSVALAESATATDTFDTPTSLQVDLLVTETLLLDTDDILSVDAALTETLLADANILSVDAVVVEVLLFSFEMFADDDGPASATDSIDAALTQSPRPPRPPVIVPRVVRQSVYQPVPTSMSEWYPWLQLVSRCLNGVLAGGQNITLASFTLSANSTTTTLTDSRIGATSHIQLQPTTAEAAAEVWWITDQRVGSAVINHSDSANTTRIYRVLIIA
jgi:hypothetical protein